MLCTVLTVAAEVTEYKYMRAARLCWQVVEKQVCGLLIGQLHSFLVLTGLGCSQALGEACLITWELDGKHKTNTWCGGHCRSMLKENAHFSAVVGKSLARLLPRFETYTCFGM